jgi:hypothetical protein
MAFERLSFYDLFREPFVISGRELADWMILSNESGRRLRGALLSELVQKHLSHELPDVTEEEVQLFVDRMRVALDYTSESQGESFLRSFDITLEELGEEVWNHLRLEKYLARRTRSLVTEGPAACVPLLWQSFLELSLRPLALRARGTQALAHRALAGPTEQDREKARSHFLALHGAEDWKSLERKLTEELGLSPRALEGAVEELAAALAAKVE